MVLLLVIGVYIYINFDRELKSNFKNKYYREIIDDYPIYCVEYLLNKTITEKTMSASILNLIYKKNIAIEETDKKHEYIFKLKNNKKLSSTEQKLVDLLFNEVGNGESFTSKDLKKAAKTESYYDAQKAWKTAVEAEAEDQNFYYTEDKFKKIAILYGVIGIVLFIINMLFDIWSLYPIFALILTIFFILLILFFILSLLSISCLIAVLTAPKNTFSIPLYISSGMSYFVACSTNLFFIGFILSSLFSTYLCIVDCSL